MSSESVVFASTEAQQNHRHAIEKIIGSTKLPIGDYRHWCKSVDKHLECRSKVSTLAAQFLQYVKSSCTLKKLNFLTETHELMHERMNRNNPKHKGEKNGAGKLCGVKGAGSHVIAITQACCIISAHV